MPVLRKIEEEYKTYSGKDLKDKINNAIKYNSSQISKYQKKYEESQIKLNEFSVKHGIFLVSQNKSQIKLPEIESIESLSDGKELPDMSLLTTNLEMERILSENLVRDVNQQINAIKVYSNDPIDILNLAKITIKRFDLEEEPLLIEQLEFEVYKLMKARNTYTPNDPYLQNLEKRTFESGKKVKEFIISTLNSSKDLANAKIKSVLRPDEIILQFKRLFISASIDEKTLDNLRNDSRDYP